MTKEEWDKIPLKRKREMLIAMRQLRHAMDGYKLKQEGLKLAEEIKSQPMFSKDASLQKAHKALIAHNPFDGPPTAEFRQAILAAVQTLEEIGKKQKRRGRCESRRQR